MRSYEDYSSSSTECKESRAESTKAYCVPGIRCIAVCIAYWTTFIECSVSISSCIGNPLMHISTSRLKYKLYCCRLYIIHVQCIVNWIDKKWKGEIWSMHLATRAHNTYSGSSFMFQEFLMFFIKCDWYVENITTITNVLYYFLLYRFNKENPWSAWERVEYELLKNFGAKENIVNNCCHSL